MTLSEILQERGYVHQCTASSLAEVTDSVDGVKTVYLGVDPTGDSLHVGHLAAYMMARCFKEAGHKVLLLVGGGTGMIGDPKPDVERPLLPQETIEKNAQMLSIQIQRILGTTEIQVVNNADWLLPLNLISFLRDVGKHFTVNSLIKKDAIADRLKSEEGITYTEFAYPLLQAYDFLHLFKDYNCTVQIGGSDQWGNITAGVDLIRRLEGETAYGITVPLVLDKSTGKKFGKSEGNAVWLDSRKTSPFQFYQFWLNVSDESVEEYLRLFTTLSLSEIQEIMKEHEADKAARKAQKNLAFQVTELIHGKPAADTAIRVSEILFGSVVLSDITPVERDVLLESIPAVRAAQGTPILDLLIATQLAASKREAKEFLEAKSVSVNEKKIDSAAATIEQGDFVNGMILLKKGKKSVALVVAE